jgi:hypothetical protein
MIDFSILVLDGVTTLDDGTAVHTFTDPAALRLFVLVWRGLRAQFPSVEFTLDSSSAILTWIGAATQPTPAQIAARVAALQAAEAQEGAENETLRTRVRALAQSAVGVQVDQLTAAQVRALFIVFLYKRGAIDRSGTVRPFGEWE